MYVFIHLFKLVRHILFTISILMRTILSITLYMLIVIFIHKSKHHCQMKSSNILFISSLSIGLAVISFSYPFVNFMVSMGRKHLSHIFIVSLLSNPGSNFVFCNVLDLLQNPFIIYKYVKMTIREVGRIVPNTNELGIKEILIRYKYQEIFSHV